MKLPPTQRCGSSLDGPSINSKCQQYPRHLPTQATKDIVLHLLLNDVFSAALRNCQGREFFRTFFSFRVLHAPTMGEREVSILNLPHGLCIRILLSADRCLPTHTDGNYSAHLASWYNLCKAKACLVKRRTTRAVNCAKLRSIPKDWKDRAMTASRCTAQYEL